MTLSTPQRIKKITFSYSHWAGRDRWVDCIVDKELFGWLHPKGSGQWLNVQMENRDSGGPIPRNIQDQAGQASEQPGLVEDNTAHCRGVRLGDL